MSNHHSPHRRGLLTYLLPVLLFAAMLALFLSGLRSAARSQSAESARIAEDSIRRAIVTCYAIEGCYPASYAYLRDGYGLRVDEDTFIIHYEVFASNIMPEVTVTRR